jgi:hypothetical protein
MKNLFTFVFGFMLFIGMLLSDGNAQTTYTWIGADGGSWAVTANWSPTRTTPAANDIMQFNDGTVKTITSVPTQTIGQLLVTGNSIVNLQAGAAVTLTISGGPGTDLSVDAGSQLNINGTFALTINLLTGTTGSISGSMTLFSTIATAHRLTAADANAILFQSGSTFTEGPFFSGSPFGTTSLGSVHFLAGSTFLFRSGSNPFGAGQPASVVVFEAGSLYKHKSSGSPSFSGRTYADVELDSVGAVINVTGGAAVSMNNLTITNGILNFNMTATPGHLIKGNIFVNTGATLNFNPATAGTVNLNGTSAQTITNNGTLSFGSFSTINLNNANGLTLGSNVNLNNLTMTTGNINTGTYTLTLGTSGSNPGILTYNAGSTTGVINGKFARWFGTSTTTNTLFPVGDAATNSSPRSVEISFTTAPTTAGILTAGYITGDPVTSNTASLDDAGYTVDTYSYVGYWQIDATLLAGGTYKVNLSPVGFLGIVPTYQHHLRILKRSSTLPSDWVLDGSHTDGSPSPGQYKASRSGLTGFSQFGIGGWSMENPLDKPMPVELSSFTSNVILRDVKLNWTTVSELNNAGFEVQKSEISGQKAGEWTKVCYINGNGTKTTPTNYTFEDRKLTTGKYSYRLKQIDYNGNFEYFNLAGIVEIGVPKKFDISQNYPNPFNPVTKIDIDLPYDSKVSMKLYDISGREVMTLMNEAKTAGYYTVQMNGVNLASGMYFYRIVATGNGQDFVSVKKLMLIK